MVLIYVENSGLTGKLPSMMKMLEERKRTIQIFSAPLRDIQEAQSTTEKVDLGHVEFSKEEQAAIDAMF
jgi:hypothetical protein